MCVDFDETGDVVGSLPGVSFRSQVSEKNESFSCSRQGVLDVSNCFAKKVCK